MKPGFEITPETSFRESLLRGWTVEELEAAFARVTPATHWKDRIDTVLPIAGFDPNLMADAIAHYTGTEALFTLSGWDKVRVIAAGYRAGPCN